MEKYKENRQWSSEMEEPRRLMFQRELEELSVTLAARFMSFKWVHCMYS